VPVPVFPSFAAHKSDSPFYVYPLQGVHSLSCCNTTTWFLSNVYLCVFRTIFSHTRA
jgi:hypothetical protein